MVIGQIRKIYAGKTIPMEDLEASMLHPHNDLREYLIHLIDLKLLSHMGRETNHI
jgi:hypothetical protein